MLNSIVDWTRTQKEDDFAGGGFISLSLSFLTDLSLVLLFAGVFAAQVVQLLCDDASIFDIDRFVVSCISLEGGNNLHVRASSILTAVGYQDEILRPTHQVYVAVADPGLKAFGVFI